jgi:hypothetical protein
MQMERGWVVDMLSEQVVSDRRLGAAQVPDESLQRPSGASLRCFLGSWRVVLRAGLALPAQDEA